MQFICLKAGNVRSRGKLVVPSEGSLLGLQMDSLCAFTWQRDRDRTRKIERRGGSRRENMRQTKERHTKRDKEREAEEGRLG